MRVLLDTNILLDAIAARDPFKEEAQEIFLMAAKEEIEGFVTANSITDIYYIACRSGLDDAAARKAIHNLMQVFSVIDVRGADCEAALALPIPDYEDAIVVECGRRESIGYIITRDQDFLETDCDPAPVTPVAFIKEMSL